MSRISKDEMITALTTAGVTVPATAALSQLRTLYLEVMSDRCADEQSAILNDINRTETTNLSLETTGIPTSAAHADPPTTAADTNNAAAAHLPPTAVAAHLPPTAATAHLPPTAVAAHLPPTAAAAHLPSTAATAHLPPTAAAVHLAPTAAAAHLLPTPTAAHLLPTADSANPLSTTAAANLLSDDSDPSATDDNLAIEAELKKLRQFKELLQLQREVSELQINTRSSAMSDVEHIESMVSPFSADDNYNVEKWLCDLEDAFEILAFDERAKFIAARRLLTGTARVFMRTVSTSSYTQLKSLLIEEFGHSCTNQEVYTQLRNRRLKHGETTKRYVLEMQEIASRGRVTETELIDLIIGGLTESRVNTTMLYGAANMRELKALLERQDRIRPTVRANRPQPSNFPAATQMPLAPTRPAAVKLKTTAAPPPAVEMNEVRCFNCSKYGHFQSQCPKPKRPDGSCFRCGKIDHVYRDCPHRPTRAIAAIHHPDMEADTEDTSDHHASVHKINPVQTVSVAFSFNDCVQGRYLDVVSLFDSGSPTSFINEKFVPYVCHGPALPSSYRGVGNARLMSLGEVEVFIMFKKRCVKHTFIILPKNEFRFEIIVGRDLLRKLCVHLCHLKNKYRKEELLKLNKRNLPVKPHLPATLISLGLLKTENMTCRAKTERPLETVNSKIANIPNSYYNDNLSETTDAFNELCAIDLSPSAPSVNIDQQLGNDKRATVLNIIKTYYFDFVVDTPLDLKYEMKIKLTTDVPVCSRPRRLSYFERGLVQNVVDDLLERGIIRPSSSPYASPIVVVRKKNGKIRKCVDYRQLNKITMRDNYPMPVIDDCLEHLGRKNIFTLIDLRSGFHQVKMHEDSIKYTSFVTPDGQWEYTKMPFGLMNAPAQFQRFINMVFAPMIRAGLVVVYLDDILIASADFQTHMKTVATVLKTLREYNLEIQLEKCKFAYSELDYLGYNASAKGIRPSNTHIKAIQQYPMPTSRIELQRCLGLFSYFRRFVKSFSTIARPMTSLLKKDSAFNFDEACQASFSELKLKLIKSPILSIYDPKRETELHCDASSAGFGAVLMQKQDDHRFHPVAYFSKTASACESKLHSYELETLAIVYALKRFHVYLEGISFLIVTDCHSLAQTLGKQSHSAKIARWALLLENYNYKIQHRAGNTMGHVDALSRVPAAIYDEADLDRQLQLMQCLDPGVKKLRAALEKGPVNDYMYKDGLVFRVPLTGNPQLYVPEGMINNVIRFVHEKLGHLGTDKTYYQIRENYWFPQMKNRIGNYIKNCLKCIIYSAPARCNQQNLHNIPKASVPFDTIHVDHFGPLPPDPSKRKYILVVTDAFTKFTKLYPSKSTSTKEVCLYLSQYFQNYSRPRRLVSDKGSCFTAAEFNQFLERLSIKHIQNATSSPQANGQVERVNRVLRPMLSKISNPIDHADWTKFLPSAEYALNNTVNITTKFKPSVLLFGVEQRGNVVDELTEHLSSKNNDTSTRIEEVRKQAADNILKSQENNMKYFLKSHSPAKEFNEGEYVVIRNVDTTSGTNKKLIPRFKGPYVIHKRLPNDRYVVTDVEGAQVTQIPYDGVLEANKLRKYVAQ